jgi:hypothetical protein
LPDYWGRGQQLWQFVLRKPDRRSHGKRRERIGEFFGRSVGGWEHDEFYIDWLDI